MRRILLLALLAIPALTGCGGAPAGGQVSGDVYLLTSNGDVKRGAANKVFLLPSPAGLGEEYSALCELREESIEQAGGITNLDGSITFSAESVDLRGLMPLAQVRALKKHYDGLLALAEVLDNQRRAFVQAAAVASAPTGVNAHYSFMDIPPGRYTLLATMILSGDSRGWIVPITIAPGDQIVLDLDNNNTGSAELSCGEPFSPIW